MLQIVIEIFLVCYFCINLQVFCSVETITTFLTFKIIYSLMCFSSPCLIDFGGFIIWVWVFEDPYSFIHKINNLTSDCKTRCISNSFWLWSSQPQAIQRLKLLTKLNLCSLYSVLCTLYSALCTLYSAIFTL